MLRILWELEPSPVREIHTRLASVKGTNYSTTVKMLAVIRAASIVTGTLFSLPSGFDESRGDYLTNVLFDCVHQQTDKSQRPTMTARPPRRGKD
jgi:hypothetical protein